MPKYRRQSYFAAGAGIVAISAVALGNTGDSTGTARASLAPNSSDASILTDVRGSLEGQESVMLPSGATLDISEDVRAFYIDSLHGAPLWTSSEGLNDGGRELIHLLRQLRDEGLSLSLNASGAVLNALPSAGALATTELLLSHTLVSMAEALNRGRIDPGKVADHKLATGAEEVAGLLGRIARGEEPGAILDAYRPNLPWYRYTVRALGDYRRAAASGGWPLVDMGGVRKIEPGASGTAIESLRARLIASLDENERRLAEVGPDPSHYDDDLAEAVRSFQARHGITIDAVVGGSTLDALNVSAADRVDELLLSLEGMRWLPNDLGDRAIFVNVAGFELHVLENGESVLSQGVVVGRPDWPTALFSDTLESIVFNPYWHVPESIQDAEILPEVRKDPEYLARKNYVVVRTGNNYGSPVSTEGFDWSSMEGYDFRQEPGPGNALGQMKFLFPNRHNIYLHDTPAVDKFKENYRAFSHGCIRLSDPEALARYLLDTSSDRSSSDVAAILAGKKRTEVRISGDIPVHLAYITAWADEGGTVHFHPDIYDRNEPFSQLLTVQ